MFLNNLRLFYFYMFLILKNNFLTFIIELSLYFVYLITNTFKFKASPYIIFKNIEI